MSSRTLTSEHIFMLGNFNATVGSDNEMIFCEKSELFVEVAPPAFVHQMRIFLPHIPANLHCHWRI